MRSFFTSRYFWIIASLAALSMLGYLLASHFTAGPGFPLDDAWIHQTYARNLGRHGQWAFLPNRISGGSTSPLWTAILALGYTLLLVPGDAPFAWTFFLGWMCLAGIALAGMRLFAALKPGLGQRRIWVGIFLLLEWHLVWAAASGMETPLMALLILVVMGEILQERPRWFLVGVLAAASVWVRPDGLTLLGPALFCWLFQPGENKAHFSHLARLAAGFIALMAPYLVFNQWVAHAFWPNTFLAKQTEYAVLRQAPYARRFLDLAALPMVGAGAILLPGFLYWLWGALRQKQWRCLAAAAWLLGYLAVYAWRLPVTYQHGRYIMPAMPVYFVTGLVGMIDWLQIRSPHMLRRVSSQVWLFAAALTLAAFWLVGAQAYAQDTAIIQTEMVAAARWVQRNVPVGEVVAAHDIGALGYYGQHALIDLAGLISPQVIPIIRDEPRLAEFLDQQHAAYLVIFPDWYSQLAQGKPLLYQTQGIYSLQQGGTNMAVYRWAP